MLDKLEGVKVTPVNAIADENIELVSEYNVFSTPTLVFLKEGKEVGRNPPWPTLLAMQVTSGLRTDQQA